MPSEICPARLRMSGAFYAVRADESKEGRNRRFPRFNLWEGRFTQILIFGPDSVFVVSNIPLPIKRIFATPLKSATKRLQVCRLSL